MNLELLSTNIVRFTILLTTAVKIHAQLTVDSMSTATPLLARYVVMETA